MTPQPPHSAPTIPQATASPPGAIPQVSSPPGAIPQVSSPPPGAIPQAASPPRATLRPRVALWLGCAATLSALWALLLPRYLLLDALALQSSQRAGLLSALGAALLWPLLQRVRARAAHPARLAFNFALSSALCALAQWGFNQRAGYPVPYVEAFSLLLIQISSACALALILYGLLLRAASPLGLSQGHLPRLKPMIGLSTALLSMLAATLLGAGALGRSQGALNRQHTERLHTLAERSAAELDRAADPAQAQRLLRAFKQALFLHAELLPAGQLPAHFTAARSQSAPPAGSLRGPPAGTIVSLSAHGRSLWVHHALRHGHLWLSTPLDQRPPVLAPEEGPAILLLALLLLGTPLAAWFVALDLEDSLHDIAVDLRSLAHTDTRTEHLGVPIAHNDELGELALSLNAVCLRYGERAQALSVELDAALASDRARARILHAASHELRTPLSTITGYCHILQQDGQLCAAQRQDIELIERASQQLLALIEDLLHMSSVQAPQTQSLQLGPVDLRALLGQIVEQAAATAPAHVALQWQPPPQLPAARADERLVRQVITNLLDNAFKYTPQGQILLSARPLTAPGPPQVCVEVADTGLGIASAHLEQIFEEFYRLDRDRGLSGTGLGLPIARRLTEQMGGTLSVRSTEGQGSTFRLCLPCATEDAPCAA